MAGWKLRKDKTPAETPGADADPAPADGASGSAEAPFLDTPSNLPDFDSDANSHFDGLEFDPDGDTSGHADGDTSGHAGGGGPLTLVDYTGPASAALSPEPHAHVYDAPGRDADGIIAMPPPEHAASQAAEPDTDFEPLSASSSWLASDFGAETPAVAPFVLDTPVPAAPAAAPQIVVHIGRLSAPFDLTKDVTTLGRPDSTLSYYPDVEIEMDDAVSRRHAEIVRRPDGYYLVDTGSTNGTRLNGETLLPHQEHLLAHGDRIHMGDRTEITFE